MNFLNFSLDDWMFYIENIHQKEICLELTRVRDVAERLGLLHYKAQIITVAGTNGKGSTVAALEAIYATAGYNVGSYTSPHLLTFNERIRVNQKLISDEDLCAAFAAIEQGRNGISLTYFEMATLAALWYFNQFSLDVIILEVGMGGRLDATNIIDADLAIITTIDLDHQDYLGDTKEAIGYEKAGILRKNIPFIYADTNPPASIIERAQSLNVKMYCLGTNFSADITKGYLHVVYEQGMEMQLPLPNIHYKAAVAACMATYCMQRVLPVTPSQLAKAMQKVFIAGRQQLTGGTVKTLYDVSHNPQAVALLADFVHRYQPKGKVHAVFSALKDKDLCGLINPMRAYVNFWYPAALTGKRAASESLIKDAFLAENCHVSKCFESPSMAYDAAINQAKEGDLIIVYGSFLTVNAVMSGIKQEVLQ